MLKCSSQTQLKTTQDMQREVWNFLSSFCAQGVCLAEMLKGVAVHKCSSQTQVQTTAGAQSKAINTITYKHSATAWEFLACIAPVPTQRAKLCVGLTSTVAVANRALRFSLFLCLAKCQRGCEN